MIANKRKVWASIIILVAFFSFIAYYFFSLDKSFENKIYPHVFVNKIDFGGKDRQKVSKYFTEKNSQLAKLVISVSYEQQPIATFSGEQLNIHYDGKGMEERAFMIGRSSNLSSRIYQKISTLILKQKFVLETKIEYDRSIVNDFVSDCEDTYNKPAKNALFKFENGRVISFSPEENGLGLESVSFKNALEKKISGLEKKPGNFNVEIASKTIVPEITLAKANNYGIEELIAVGKSDYTHSIPERTHNIILAASKFDGVLIPKNEVFFLMKPSETSLLLPDTSRHT
jgi:vancomycin resistance protein YoaR